MIFVQFWAFEFCHLLGFWVFFFYILSHFKFLIFLTVWFLSHFEFFSSVTFWVFGLCHMLSFWALSYLNFFLIFHTFSFCILSHFMFLSFQMLILEFCHILSFVTFLVFVFCHILSWSVLSNFNFFELCHILFFLWNFLVKIVFCWELFFL